MGESTGRTRRDLLVDGTKVAAGLAAANALAPTGPFGAAQALADPKSKLRRPGFGLAFKSLKDETFLPSIDLDGKLPQWLTGSLLRNGPALFEIGEEKFNHWFDGLAMLHAFSFKGGKVSYRNRFLRSSQYWAWQREGRIKFSELATDPAPDPCRQIFSGVSTLPVLGRIPNANVSIEKLAGEFRAHTEIPIPVRFNPKFLNTMGIGDAGQMQGRLGTAHPHFDPETRERFSYEVELVPPSGLRIVSEKGRTRRELAFIPQAMPGYLHSFGLTRRFVVIVSQPFNFNLSKFLSPDRGPIITNYEWQGEEPTRIILVDRQRGGVAHTVETDSFFAFHHINAYEHEGKVIVDVCAHKDAGVIDALYLKKIRSGSKVPQARYRRFEIRLEGQGKLSQRDLIDAYIELPQKNYGRVNGRHYRYAYGVGLRKGSSGFIDQLVKADVKIGESKLWREWGVYPGEPVFVPRPGGKAEDDGVILSVILDGRRRKSALLVLDARNMEEIARASVPHHIPFGFHGLYAS
ncbi:MAG TPA: carotenoid oxygenase family protein [Solirubrobacterales bacterium]|nr:carotenoid oxygenase family protein [Solirubrobacterales bacterium]